MKPSRIIFAGALLLPLAAAATWAQGAYKITPGLWETKMTVVEFKMQGLPPNMPPGMADRMKPAPTTVRACVTPEQAANPGAQLMAARRQGHCDVKKMSMTGGNVSIAMICAGERGGGTANILMTGRYGATSYTMNGDMTMTGQKGMSMHMKTHTEGKRIGACKS